MTGRAPELEIRWAQSTAEVQGALRVREQVFCREQGVPRAQELDGLDDRALHMLAFGPQDRVIGTLRLVLVGGVAKIGRVAVERDWRGRGIASRMLGAAVSLAEERGCHEARLASQLPATGLYERAGFTVESKPFEEAGIPHVWMRRGLGWQKGPPHAGR
jgi:predicted GNAT family N-acyltransferase